MQCVLSQVNPSVCDSHRRLHVTVSRHSGICLAENLCLYLYTMLSSVTRSFHKTARGFATGICELICFSYNIFILYEIIQNENEK